MKEKRVLLSAILFSTALFYFSCQKDASHTTQQQQELSAAAANPASENPTFNLEVILRGEGNTFGLVKFRQNVDPSKIITLDTWVRDLQPNHSYLLQRAVDPINVVDGNCTSTAWLTLGKGLTPQSITTDATGTGREQLWRDVSAVASGSSFDIHFRIVDATTMQAVLTSDCYQYFVR